MCNQLHYYDYTQQLSKVLNRAHQGQELKIGFLGGSITQGCNPSIPQNAYTFKVYEWLKAYFPNSEVSYINAGIGATGSLIAAHRMKEDLLKFEPDIIIVEFAANDVPPTELSKKAYESVIRRIVNTLPSSAVVELFMTLNTGVSAEAQQIQIGHHYNIPMISYRQTIFNGIGKGDYVWKDLVADEVHPNDRGHALVAKLLTHLFEYAAKQQVDEGYLYACPEEVLFSKAYETGFIVNHHHLCPISYGSFEKSSEGFKTLKDGWRSMDESNKVFICEIRAKTIYLLYTKGIEATRGTVEIRVNHSEPIEVDSFFDGGWGSYAETKCLVEGKEEKLYTIELKVKNKQGQNLFNILGFLVTDMKHK